MCTGQLTFENITTSNWETVVLGGGERDPEKGAEVTHEWGLRWPLPRGPLSAGGQPRLILCDPGSLLVRQGPWLWTLLATGFGGPGSWGPEGVTGSGEAAPHSGATTCRMLALQLQTRDPEHGVFSVSLEKTKISRKKYKFGAFPSSPTPPPCLPLPGENGKKRGTILSSSQDECKEYYCMNMFARFVILAG